jgi:pyruvate dehydrogenase E2 component (dihydrolipoamide acetyltransferase)
MATNVIMPSLGFDMTEGKVAAWLASEGAAVAKGAPLVEIETEKATVEVESPASGILARIVVGPGKTVKVGTVIGIVAEPGEKLPEAPAETGAPTPEPASEKAAAAPAAHPATEAGGRVKASPVARRMAETAGIDLAQVTGSGPDGRVMERDVEAAIASRGAAAPPAPAPQSRMRQAIARRMAESKATAPHFYASVEIRMDALLKLRHPGGGVPPAGAFTVNDAVIAAAARALVVVPELNASWRDGGVVVHPEIGIGIAVALDDGLVTPVLHDAQRKTLAEIAAESHALAARAHAGKLRPEDVSGGTFTISNMSMMGIDEFVAIINPPEAGILAVGAVIRRPVADGDAVRIAPVTKVTLSADHRVVDGAAAARFLVALRKLLENPAGLAPG